MECCHLMTLYITGHTFRIQHEFKCLYESIFILLLAKQNVIVQLAKTTLEPDFITYILHEFCLRKSI